MIHQRAYHLSFNGGEYLISVRSPQQYPHSHKPIVYLCREFERVTGYRLEPGETRLVRIDVTDVPREPTPLADDLPMWKPTHAPRDYV